MEFLSLILKWRSISCQIIPPLLLVLLVFHAWMGRHRVFSGHPILREKWRLMQQMVAPLSIKAVVSAIFPFSVL